MQRRKPVVLTFAVVALYYYWINAGDSGRHQESAYCVRGSGEHRAGPQQVNNGTPPASLSAPASRAGNQESEPIKLLEAAGEPMDFGTTNTTGRGDQAMAPVGTVNRPTNR
jgi:hypothetical protein